VRCRMAQRTVNLWINTSLFAIKSRRKVLQGRQKLL
jgi:hypothetical protein